MKKNNAFLFTPFAFALLTISFITWPLESPRAMAKAPLEEESAKPAPPQSDMDSLEEKVLEAGAGNAGTSVVDLDLQIDKISDQLKDPSLTDAKRRQLKKELETLRENKNALLLEEERANLRESETYKESVTGDEKPY